MDARVIDLAQPETWPPGWALVDVSGAVRGSIQPTAEGESWLTMPGVECYIPIVSQWRGATKLHQGDRWRYARQKET